MKKLISILVLGVIFTSCKNVKEVKNQSETSTIKKVIELNNVLDIIIIELDSCEYITITGGYESGVSIIHKNNCKFCVKRNGK